MKLKYFKKKLTKSIRQMDEVHQAIALGMGLTRFKEWVEQTPKGNLPGGGAEYLGDRGNRWCKSFNLEGNRYLYYFDYYSPKEGTCSLERIELKEIPRVDPLEKKLDDLFSD